MFGEIARKNNGVIDSKIIEQTKKVLEEARLEDIVDFNENIEDDSTFTQLSNPTPEEKKQQTLYADSFAKSMDDLNSESVKLVRSMFLAFR